jgi:glycosyltransferase involved in cell wall biosynthesis
LARRNALLREVLESANRLIAPTRFVKDWYTGQGLAPDNLVEITPGLKLPAPISPDGRQSEGSVNLVYIGGLVWQKGIHVLLEALNGIQGAYCLLIAGDESADPAYAALLRAQATEQTRFLGTLTQAEVQDTLAHTDVVAVPSLCQETYSFIVTEAFAAGVPVIASRIGALEERIRDGVDGVLLPPGATGAWRIAVQRLINEPSLLRQLGANVPPVKTLDEHVDQVEALYAAVLKEI